MNKKTIAFVTGGYSGESVISYKSAITIENNIDKDRYKLFKIDVHPTGWWYETDEGEEIAVDKNDFSITVKGNKVVFDAVFIGIHGTPGEDGKLQGYFDLLRIPYTSCSAATSALTFNKSNTVAVAAFGGINVARSVLLIKDNFTNADEIVRPLKFPVFVKPNNGGSSIGMSKVNALSEELGMAIEKAFKEDDQVLIEEFIQGREFTIGVFKSGGQIITLPMTEIMTKNVFFDYEAKYTAGISDEITPAIADEDTAQKVRRAAAAAYQLMDCRGVVRIDFIFNKFDLQPYMLEINTVPGQSAASIIPKQVQAMGMTLKDFYSLLIEECFKY